MLAVQLMLQGIPVDLSPLHPLADQLGLQIPSMKRDEALERLHDVICRTTPACRECGVWSSGPNSSILPMFSNRGLWP